MSFTVLTVVASAGLLSGLLPTPTPAPTAKPASGSLLGGLLGGLTGHNSSSPNSGLALPSLCLLCTPTPAATPTLPVPTPTLPVPTPCLFNCPPTHSPGCTSNCGSNPGGNNGTQTTATPAPDTVTGTVPVSTGGNSSGLGGGSAADPPTPGAITIQPPPAVETLSPVAGISFGKAPFLWPLFIVLDFLGLGAVVLVLRKTWSRPVTD